MSLDQGQFGRLGPRHLASILWIDGSRSATLRLNVHSDALWLHRNASLHIITRLLVLK